MFYYTLGRVFPPQSKNQSEERVAKPFEDYDELLKENKDRVFNLLFRLTGDHHTAEDLFQETFLRAYRGLGLYEGKSKPSTWIYSVALNVYRDHYRRSRKSGYDIRIEDVDFFPPAGPGSSPEEAFLMKEERAELQELLVSLRPALRVPFVLFYIEELTVGDIAAVTGRSEPSIKTALHRARTLLKAKLGGE